MKVIFKRPWIIGSGVHTSHKGETSDLVRFRSRTDSDAINVPDKYFPFLPKDAEVTEAPNKKVFVAEPVYVNPLLELDVERQGGFAADNLIEDSDPSVKKSRGRPRKDK